MSDEALETSTPAEPAAASEAPAPAPEPAAEADPAWAEPDEIGEGVQQFERAYVEKLRGQAADYRTRARDLHEKVETWGGTERVEQAVKFLTDAGTEEGTIKLFIEAGQALGLGFDKLESLFDKVDAAAAAEVEAAAPADDDVLTWKEARELLQKEVLEPAQRAQEQTIINTARATVADSLKDVPKEDHAAVLALGQEHIADGDFDPEHIRAAVRKGVEILQTTRARDREAYLAEKLKELQDTPSATGGSGAPGGEAPAPPKNWEEAKARGRLRITEAERAAAASR